MTFTPFPSQVDDLATLRENNYTALLAIEAGGGKTWLTAMAIQELKPAITLISAPKSTINKPSKNWPDAMAKMLGQELKVIGNDNKKQKLNTTAFELGMPGIYACTHQFAARKSTDVSGWGGDLLIVDECHQVATPKTAAQRRFSGFYPSDKPLSRRFNHRLALSGTPLRQNFVNIWATMRLLWPHLNGYGEVACDNFWAWATERMTKKTIPREWEWVPLAQQKAPADARINWIGGEQCWMRVSKEATNWIAEADEGRLISEAPCVIIHKRRETCCRHHQPVQREDGTWTKGGFLSTEEPQEIIRTVDLTAKQRKAIQELEEHAMTYLGDNPLVTKLPITLQQRIRQICLGEPVVTYWVDDEDVERSQIEFEDDCVSPFATELEEILTNEVPETEPVVVFLESQRFASVLTKKLNKAGITAQEYSGKTKADLDKFGEDYRVLVGQVGAIGTGTDGLGQIAINEVWMEIPVSITTETQAQARLDRLGSRGQIQRWLIQDELGYSKGRMSSNVEKRLQTNASMRKRV